MTIDRRRFLTSAALLAGGTLSFGCLRAFEERGDDARRAPSRPGLDVERRARLERAADLILPETDTPGALQAGVPDFVEMMIVDYYHDDERAVIESGLDALEQRAIERAGVGFVDAPEDAQTAILTELAAEGEAEIAASGANPMARLTMAPPPPPPAFFQSLRELVALGYTTSEVAGQHVIEFTPYHQGYEPCAPMNATRRPEVM